LSTLRNLLTLICLLASVLVLPLAALLFAQWPLREVVQAGSRLANDMAQILFAVYAAVAVTAASLAHTHLAAARHDPGREPRRWRRIALAACVGPWALFMLWSSFPLIRDSVTGLEKFSETLAPGFFVIKLALGLLLLLALAEALVSALDKTGKDGDA
jgi:TRAP-type C4-dicarboxylate transport system permease small subunit